MLKVSALNPSSRHPWGHLDSYFHCCRTVIFNWRFRDDFLPNMEIFSQPPFINAFKRPALYLDKIQSHSSSYSLYSSFPPSCSLTASRIFRRSTAESIAHSPEQSQHQTNKVNTANWNGSYFWFAKLTQKNTTTPRSIILSLRREFKRSLRRDKWQAVLGHVWKCWTTQTR